eukprot:scaffold269742_cov44-Prasinocladus_malaysianus.AAC.1
MLEQKMLRELDGNTPCAAKKGKRKTKKKKKKSCAAMSATKKVLPEDTTASLSLLRPFKLALSEGPDSMLPKKRRQRRKKKSKNRMRMLLGQDGVDYLREVSKESGIITGCHEYNACEVKTLAANQTFLPKVSSPAHKYPKAPLGFRSRSEFPACLLTANLQANGKM